MNDSADFLDRLDVIKSADDLVLKVYQYTKALPKSELFGLTSQMRRAAVSVPANTAEGYSRQSKKEKIQFYHISKGSLTELRYYIKLAYKLDYLGAAQTKDLIETADKTARLLVGLINYTRDV